MFVLVTREQTVKLPPSSLASTPILTLALQVELDRLYCNRVITDQGLVIRSLDILDIGDPLIHPGDPSICIKTRFRLVLFRPLPGELFVAQIKASTPEGLRLSLGFFDDIVITPCHMQPGTVFDQVKQRWVWHYQNDEQRQETDNSYTNDFYLEPGHLCRAKIVSEAFKEDTCDSVKAIEAAHYLLVASIAEDGLGLLSWWD